MSVWTGVLHEREQRRLCHIDRMKAGKPIRTWYDPATRMYDPRKNMEVARLKILAIRREAKAARLAEKERAKQAKAAARRQRELAKAAARQKAREDRAFAREMARAAREIVWPAMKTT